MDNVIDQSIDYIFTDPPYGDTIQYSELSYVWNTWLGKNFDIEEEVIINPVQQKDSSTFNSQLDLFFKEAWRVLKNNKFLTLCFQNKNVAIWADLAKIIQGIGFELVDISVYDTLGSPYNKNWSKYSPKSDFYITFKKVANKPIKIPDNRKVITAEDLILISTEGMDSKNFNIGKAYDDFVINLIKYSFKNYDVVIPKNLNIQTVIDLIERDVKY